MTILTGTYLPFDVKGMREDLSNLIANIAPEDTPTLTNAGRKKVRNTFWEWQRDTLAAAGANAQLQGDNLASYTAAVPTVRMGNRTQISRKTASVADTMEATDRAGRDGEMAYQMALRMAEIKRDQEFIIHSNVGALTGSAAVAPLTGTLGAMVGSISGSNVDMGAAGTNPTDAILFTDPRNDGTQRAFVEASLKTVVAGNFNDGGHATVLQVGTFNKGVVSGFTGIATKTYNQDAKKPAAIIASADVYVGEFVVLSVIANRFQRSRDAWGLDYSAIKIATLRPYKTVELAKTGDAENKMLVVEWGLEVSHEQKLFLVADLLTA